MKKSRAAHRVFHFFPLVIVLSGYVRLIFAKYWMLPVTNDALHFCFRTALIRKDILVFERFFNFYLTKIITLPFNKINIFYSTNKKYPQLISNLLIALVGFFLIKAQLFDKYNPTWHEWTHGRYPLVALSKQPFKVYGRFTTEQKQAAEWLKKNAPKNAKIIADGFTNEALDFFDVADYEIPIFHLKRGIPLGSIKKRDDSVQPLYLITYSGFDRGSQRHRVIFPIFEEDIVGVLKKENPDYLVISGRGLFFSAYFDKARWACLKFDNKHVRIYEIHLERIKPVTLENVGVNETIN